MIVGYLGEVLAQAVDSGEAFVSAPINIDALRNHRNTSTRFNPLLNLKTEIYAGIYNESVYPPNTRPRTREERERSLKLAKKRLEMRMGRTKSVKLEKI